MLRIDPVFLEFTYQMENRGKDGIWELSVLLSLAGWVRRIYLVFLEFIEKKMENRVEDSMWELRVLFTCSMNA